MKVLIALHDLVLWFSCNKFDSDGNLLLPPVTFIIKLRRKILETEKLKTERIAREELEELEIKIEGISREELEK